VRVWSRLFLCVYLTKHPVETSAVVIGLGEKSFTLLVPGTTIHSHT
jgi:hypothetical protein